MASSFELKIDTGFAPTKPQAKMLLAWIGEYFTLDELEAEAPPVSDTPADGKQMSIYDVLPDEDGDGEHDTE